MTDLEKRTMRHVSWRLLPLIVVIYFIAYIDRSNVGFAASGMHRDFGFSAYLYGWGAGIFFIGYFFFEVPSNLILERVGARRWIARIMVTWGVVACAMIFVRGPLSFLGLRFLLGLAEAGFFPGVLLYFTYWFPYHYRARVTSTLFIAGPGSNAVAAAVSGALLKLDGAWGLAGWKWIFLVEGAPAILLAPVVLLLLSDKPSTAKWLPPEEREWLESQLASEQKTIDNARRLTLGQALTDRRVLGLSLVYLTIVTATYGITFFLPLIVKAYGMTDVATGLVTAIPYTVGLAGMILWAQSSDARRERRWHFIVATLVAAAGLTVSALGFHPLMSLAAMSIAAVGIYGSKPAFWPVPSEFLSGTAAAGGIALVNAIGNLGGFVGPSVVGWIRDITHSYAAGLYFLAACAAASAALAFFVIRPAGTPIRHGVVAPAPASSAE